MFKTIKSTITLFICLFIITTSTFETYSQNRGHINTTRHIRNIPHYDYRPYHFGFLIGLNQMNFALKPIESYHNLNMEAGSHNYDTLYSVLSKPEYGFNIGIVSNLKLYPQLDLRFTPTLSFGDRNINYKGVDENGNPIRENQLIESTFLDFPLYFKYKSVRINNTRVYVLAGAKYSYDLISAEDKDEIDEQVLARISKNDFYYELGVGFDHYFYYFKLSTEIKVSFGVKDILKNENTIYTNSIDDLKSRIIQLSFQFE